jgi:hypothetical protein
MLLRILGRLRWPLLAAGASAFVCVSVAGATNNAPLVVAQNNTATLQTALQGSMAAPVLLITNFSTAAGAYGLDRGAAGALPPQPPARGQARAARTRAREPEAGPLIGEGSRPRAAPPCSHLARAGGYRGRSRKSTGSATCPASEAV